MSTPTRTRNAGTVRRCTCGVTVGEFITEGVQPAYRVRRLAASGRYAARRALRFRPTEAVRCRSCADAAADRRNRTLTGGDA